MNREFPDTSDTLVGPHEFDRLSRFRHRNKCRACYWPKQMHPTTGWIPARPLGDKGEHPWSTPTGWSAAIPEGFAAEGLSRFVATNAPGASNQESEHRG